MKIVAQGGLSPETQQHIRSMVPEVRLVMAASMEEAVIEIADADAFLGQITPPLLKAGQKLRWVQAWSAGLERLMFPELVVSLVVLTNLRGIYNDQGADHALALMLALAKRLPRAVRQQCEGRWDSRDYQRIDLEGCTLGIIGLGGIGYELARRGHVCSMRVIAVDARRTERPLEVECLWLPERLDDLLSQSDFVVCCAPHTPQTEGLMTLEKFRRMKRSSFFVNIGRGAIVRLNDLVQALGEGAISGAGLDVFEVEPLPADHPLWKFPNVILTPHVAAGGTPVNERRRDDLVVENIRRFARGEPLLNVVEKIDWF